jgi:hypothetical protein
MALVTLNDPPEVPRKSLVKAGVLLAIRPVQREPGAPSLDDFVPPAGAPENEEAGGE